MPPDAHAMDDSRPAPSCDLVCILPHTHWDREWYLPFEQFRARLVDTVDRLLEIMQADPSFERFTLDGQSIILSDYLAMRPERAPLIADLIRQRRLGVGPWYVLPDEFLVSGEALIRNLAMGRRTAAPFGEPLATGYLPDSFGHIAQMPQILRGFGIEGAMLSRGLGDEGEALGSEFWWEALDGSRVLCVHQVRGYCNLVALGYRMPSDLFEERPPDPELAVERVRQEVGLLEPYARAGVILLNNGCDHQPASPHLSQLIARLRSAFPHLAIRWATPDDVIREILARRPDLGVWRGELRGSRYTPLIPGVLSARTYLKQANEAAQTALERCAEPMAALAWTLGEPDAHAFLDHAWELLLQNHPHDSICGCSVDAVHREMLPRFDRVRESAEEITRGSMQAIARRIDTEGVPAGLPLVVFNVLNWARTEPARVTVSLTPQMTGRIGVVDAEGRPVPWQITSRASDVLARERIPADQFAHRIRWLSHEVDLAWGVRFADFSIRRGRIVIHAADPGVTPPDVIPRLVRAVRGQRAPIHVQVQRERVELVFLAGDVPPLGYRVFVLASARTARHRGAEAVVRRGSVLENGRVTVRVAPNGTVTVRDKGRGVTFRGHLLEDTGDAGDEYDYSPVNDPRVLSRRLRGGVEPVSSGPVEGKLRVRLPMRLPVGLRLDRRRRDRRTAACPVSIEVTLTAGSRRVEFLTTVDNRAYDHRLRVLFPSGLHADHAASDVQFGAVERPLQRPAGKGWAQPPQPTAPHQSWVDVSDGRAGLAVLSAGLHEHEIIKEKEGLTIALTLLRAVGWLSRDDLRTRSAHAGPGYETPEAQCLGVHRFRYVLLTHAGRWPEADVSREALALRVPLRVLPATRHPGSLPAAHSFVRCDGVIVSALQAPDSGQGLLIRVYNPLPREETAVITTSLPLRGVQEVDLAGEEMGEIAHAGGVVRLPLRAFQMKTVRLKLSGNTKE